LSQLFIIIYNLLLLYGVYAKGLQATGACSPKKKTKNKTTRYIINLLSYLTTMAESLMEMEGCDTYYTGKENEIYNNYCHQSASQNDSTYILST